MVSPASGATIAVTNSQVIEYEEAYYIPEYL
jgi:hypothetical protein